MSKPHLLRTDDHERTGGMADLPALGPGVMEELRQEYRRMMPQFEDISARHDGVSGPLLMSVPDGYHRAQVRLMIIGQQTHGWEDVTVGLDKLLKTYQKFFNGPKNKGSPFWQASHQVFREVNPDGPERAFLWSNLVRVDQCHERPRPEIENAVSDLRLLNREILLLRPDAVVFFTGPNYDDRLRQTFSGVQYCDLAQYVAQLEHPDLPTKSFRTYHPYYLRQAKKEREVLDAIIGAIRGA